MVDGDKISIKSSQDGVSVESDDVKKSLQSNELSLIDQKEITVDSKKISPEILTEDYSKLKGLAEKVIAKNIYFMLPIGNKIDKFATTAEESKFTQCCKRREWGVLTNYKRRRVVKDV